MTGRIISESLVNSITRFQLKIQTSNHFFLDKVYSNAYSELVHFHTYQRTLRHIEEHNEAFSAGRVSWKKGVNYFTDMVIFNEVFFRNTEIYGNYRSLRNIGE